MNNTIDYYNNNAQEYFRLTREVDMSPICEEFLEYVRPGGKIIDIGSGSGRDIKYFLDRGYKATGIDASKELCRISRNLGLNVENITIQEWKPKDCYDGIWANASLVHIPLKDIEDFIIKAKGCLNKNGVIFVSMKVGLPKEYDEKGRFFCPFDESSLAMILQKQPSLQLLEKWYTKDNLARSDFRWLNFILI